MVSTQSHNSRHKPAKPYPSFPLTAHNNGQWCKKIRGRVHFFGVWGEPQAALDAYLRTAADLHAGRQPTPKTISADGTTVKDVCNYFLTYQLAKLKEGNLTARWFEDCRKTALAFAKCVGATRCVSELTPDDFQHFRRRLSQTGMRDKGGGLGVFALARAITVIRQMFKYAWEMDLLDRPVKYGKALEKPSAAIVRKSRQAFEQKNGKRMFSVSEILEMLKATSGPLRAMVLLAINGGYGNTDCARLPIFVVDLKQGLIDYGRTKTGVERIVPLWPETIAAIKDVLAKRPKPRDKEAGNLVFLTSSGMPWVRERIKWADQDPAKVEKVVVVDDVCREFSRLLISLKIKRRGVGFYALRHSFRTFADEVKDPHAVFRIMGHVVPGMSGIYVEKIDLTRLRAVVDYVRAKLFQEPASTMQEVSGLSAPDSHGN